MREKRRVFNYWHHSLQPLTKRSKLMGQQRIPSDLDPNRSLSNSIPKSESEDGATKSFSSLMQPDPALQQTEQMMVSPLQLAQLATAGPQNPATFLNQLQLAQNSMLNIQEHLAQPNLKLNASQKAQIKTKLISANENLQSAHIKMGGELEQQPGPDDDAGGAPSKGPISQYLGYLTDGLHQIESSKQFVKQISSMEGAKLSPGDFLLIQLKLAKAQQQLEFTGLLLSKTVDGFKQIMSVQL